MSVLEIRNVPGGKSRFLLDPEGESTNTWFVDSVNGTDGAGYGLERGGKALASLAYLITNASTLGLAAGDSVELAPNHNEGIADAQISIATASLNIYGHPLAHGSDRPTFDFDHANAEITISADDVHIKNVILRPSITAVLVGVEIATDVTGTVLEDIEWAIGEDGAGADEFVQALRLVSGNHDTVMRRLKILTHASAAQATHGIHIDAASNRLVFDSVVIDGAYATNGILEDAAGVNHVFRDCKIDTTGTNIAFHGSSTFAERHSNWDGGAPEDMAGNILGRDDNNNAYASTNVVANEDGSIIERLEHVQEAINKGTGTALGANKSVIDVLGATGAAFDAAARASATASIGAVLRELSDYAGLRCVEKSDGAVLNGDDDLFTITGGPIMVVEFVGIVTTVIGGAANCTIQEAVTEPAGDVALSTTVAIDSDAAGTSYTFTAAAPGVLTPTTAGGLANVPTFKWLCPIGTIQALCSAAQTGVIKWYMVYRPLSENSRVVAAA